MGGRARGQDARLLPPACAALAGTWAGLRLSGPAPSWAGSACVCIAAIAALACARRWRGNRRSVALAGILAATAIGCAGHTMHIEGVHNPDAVHELAESGAYVHLTGTILSRPKEDATGAMCEADIAVHSLRGRSVEYSFDTARALPRFAYELGMPERSRIYAQIHLPECDAIIGQAISLEGRAALPWRQAGRALEVTASAYRLDGEGAATYRHVAHIDAAVGEALAGFPSHARGLVPGVALGDDSHVAPELAEAMACAQLTHLTAVSGAHVSLLMGLALRILGRRHALRAGIACAGVLAALVILVGPHASVIRACLMGALICLGIVMRRSTGAIAALSAAILAACIVNPYLALSYGFLLSASATAGIVLIGLPLERRMRARPPARFPRLFSSRIAMIVRESVAMSLAAQLACLPVLMAFTHASSIWGALANALVAPAIAPLTICGLLAALIAPFLPTIAQIILLPASACTAWIAQVAMAVAAWPGSGIALSSSAIFLALFALAARRWGWAPVIAYSAAGALCLISSSLTPHASAIPEEWEAIQCDVGQGSAFLARAQGRTIMVDVGPRGGAGARCVNEAGIAHLDVLVLSHFHADHIGALEEVMAQADIEAVWVSPNSEPHEESAWARRILEEAGVPIYEARAGDALYAQGTALMEVLNPGEELCGDANEDSLAVLLHVAGGVLVLGDADGDAQGPIAGRIAEPVRSVVVAHHGSAKQSPRLVRIAQPEYALISVGENDYGHPTQQAVDTYSSAHVLTTEECGHIALTEEGIFSSCTAGK